MAKNIFKHVLQNVTNTDLDPPTAECKNGTFFEGFPFNEGSEID